MAVKKRPSDKEPNDEKCGTDWAGWQEPRTSKAKVRSRLSSLLRLRSQACSASHVGTSLYLNNAASCPFEATVLIVASSGWHTCLTRDVPMSAARAYLADSHQVTIARRISPRCTSGETPSRRLQFERVGVARECGSRRLAVPARGGS